MRKSAPRRFSNSSVNSRLIQVPAWTPLVTCPIGTSCSSKPDHRPANICRDTWPWRRLTPLARWARRRPMMAMLNIEWSPSGSAPSWMIWSTPRPVSTPCSPK